MISALALARSYSARLALGALKNSMSNSEASSSNNPASRLLGAFNLDTSVPTGLDSKTLSILLQTLQSQSSRPGVDKPSQAIPGVIGSKNFMTALKDKLSGPSNDPTSYVTYRSMMAALKDGTLEVTNPATGETVMAFDPKDGKNNASASTTDGKTWNTFLDDHLKRNSDGSFAKSPDGSYIDTKTGQNAYFDKIDGTYYYFTWPGKVSANV